MDTMPLQFGFSLVLRIAGLVWGSMFVIGVWSAFNGLLHLRPYESGDNLLVFPWLTLPLAASAGVGGGFGLLGPTRMDEVARCGLFATALWAGVSVASLGVDLRTNRHPTDHALGAAIFATGLLLLVIYVALRSTGVPWRQLWRLMASLVPMCIGVIVASFAFSGWSNASHTGMQGWGMFTTPVVAAATGFFAMAALGLVWLACRVSRVLPADR